MGDNVLVNVTSAQMRSWGRQALLGKWGISILATMLFSLLTVLPVIVIVFLFDTKDLDWIINLYSIVVSGPLTLGYIVFILAIFRHIPTTPSEVFYGFEHFGRALGLFIVRNILVLLWSLLFIIPGIVAAYRYSLCFYVLADHPDIGIGEALAESKRLMQGNKWKLFVLELSFFGWMLLTALTAGIGTFWLLPYMTATSAGFYEIANGNLRPKRTIADSSQID